MEMRFCRRCGSSLTHKQGLVFVCENSHIIFANPSPCARIIVLSANNEFVLQIRGIEPYKGRLDTFGGFVEEDEPLEDVAMRELYEEAGIVAADCSEPKFISSGTAPYPYKGEVLTSHVATFVVRLHEGVVPIIKEEVDQIQIIPAKELDIEQLVTLEIQKAAQKVINLLEKDEI